MKDLDLAVKDISGTIIYTSATIFGALVSIVLALARFEKTYKLYQDASHQRAGKADENVVAVSLEPGWRLVRDGGGLVAVIPVRLVEGDEAGTGDALAHEGEVGVPEGLDAASLDHAKGAELVRDAGVVAGEDDGLAGVAEPPKQGIVPFVHAGNDTTGGLRR